MQRFIREVNTTNRACVLWDLAEDADYIIQVQSIGLYGESQASKRVHFRTLKETDRLPSNSSNQGEGIAQVPPVGPSPFHFVATLCLLPGGCLNAGCESKRDDVQHGSLQKAVGCVPSSQSTFVCQGEVGLSLWLLRSLNDAGHEVGSAGRVNAASPARLLFSVGDITMEGLDKDRQLQTGEIIIIVAVLLMWAAVIALFCRQYDIIKDNDSNNNKEKTKPSSEHSTPERPTGGLLRSKKKSPSVNIIEV